MAGVGSIWLFCHDVEHLNGLPFLLVQQGRLVRRLPEVDMLQVNATNIAVVHGAVVDASVGNVCGYCPLCGTGDVGYFLSLRELDACRDVEVVQDVKGLQHSLLGCSLFGCCRLEEGCPHKA